MNNTPENQMATLAEVLPTLFGIAIALFVGILVGLVIAVFALTGWWPIEPKIILLSWPFASILSGIGMWLWSSSD